MSQIKKKYNNALQIIRLLFSPLKREALKNTSQSEAGMIVHGLVHGHQRKEQGRLDGLAKKVWPQASSNTSTNVRHSVCDGGRDIKEWATEEHIISWMLLNVKRGYYLRLC